MKNTNITASELPDLGGKFVIVGVSAEGVANPVPTPGGNVYPQLIQAHMLQNFIDGSNITRRNALSAVYRASVCVVEHGISCSSNI